MSIKKTIKFTTGSVTLPPTSSSHVLPIGVQPEGNLDSLGKLKETVDNLCSNIDKLTASLKTYREENKKLKDALESLGVKEVEKILILSKDMEVEDGYK